MPDRSAVLGAALFAALAPQLARGQNSPLRIVVPFSAGSGTDTTARVLAEALHQSSGRAAIVDSAFLSPGVAGPAIRSGQLRGLGIAGNKRSILLPDVPTLAEQGLLVQDIPAWSGIFAGSSDMPLVLRTAKSRCSASAPGRHLPWSPNAIVRVRCSWPVTPRMKCLPPEASA